MKLQRKLGKQLTTAILVLALLLALTACGQSAPAQGAEENIDTLKGIYELLISPDSNYSKNKAIYAEYYPELEYSETLGPDRITIALKANGNEYLSDGSWDFVQDGDRLTCTIADDDLAGIMYVLYVANAIGSYYGMEPALVSGYLNGVSVLEIENDNFSMTRDEAAGTTLYSLNIAGPWEMKELDRMVLTEAVLDEEQLDENDSFRAGNVGKLMYLTSGNVSRYTVLIAEYGGLDDLAYQSIVNLVTLRKPVGYESFLADFTELKALETDDLNVVLDPDDNTIAELMGERNDKYRYILVRFGGEEYGETELEVDVPTAEEFSDLYFRVVANIPQGTAGSSLAQAQAACDVLGFAYGSELWLADVDMLRANMLEAWDSLTDEEQANFDSNFPALNELLNSCFADRGSYQGLFDDAGVGEAMEELLENGTAQWSWETLSANTWTLGNSEG